MQQPAQLDKFFFGKAFGGVLGTQGQGAHSLRWIPTEFPFQEGFAAFPSGESGIKGPIQTQSVIGDAPFLQHHSILLDGVQVACRFLFGLNHPPLLGIVFGETKKGNS